MKVIDQQSLSNKNTRDFFSYCLSQANLQMGANLCINFRYTKLDT
jgi:hypothetical protein